MKKVMRVVAVVTLFMLGTSLMAKEPKLTTEESSKSVVFNWEGSMANTTLSIIDSEGNIIYSDFLQSSEDYSKKFNLKTLTEGDYYFKVQNAIKEITYSLKVTQDTAFILSTDEKFKPVFKNKKGMVYVNYFNVEKAPIEVIVYDSVGRKLYTDTMENEMLVTKVFNFKDAYAGEYSIILKNDTSTYSETVYVK